MAKILETERLILQTWTLEDSEEFLKICSDAEVMNFIGDGKPYNLEQANKFLIWAENYQRENGFCRWKVLEKVSGEIVGSCGFVRLRETGEIELGYLLARKFWGKGFATEAARGCLQFGFGKLGFREIIALTDLENVASRNVLEKIGFIKRGIEVYNEEKSLVYLAKKSNE